MSVTENDSTVSTLIPASPVDIYGQPYIPVGSLAKALGAATAWTQSTKRVDIITGTSVISFWIGGNTALVNGKNVTIDRNDLDVTPVLQSPGYAMIPAGFVSSVLGEKVSYNQATGAVTLSGKYKPSPFVALSGISPSMLANLANMLQNVNGDQAKAQANMVKFLKSLGEFEKSGQPLKFGATEDKNGNPVTAEQNLTKHFWNHGSESGASSEQEYQQIGQAKLAKLKAGSPDMRAKVYFYENNLEKPRLCIYDKSDNTFVAIGEDTEGKIATETIFPPSAGDVYFATNVKAGLDTGVELVEQEVPEEYTVFEVIMMIVIAFAPK